MKLTIITPTGTRFSGTVAKVELPSAKGRMQVLKDHAPLLASLTVGEVVADSERFPIQGGVARVENNEVLVCTL